MSDLCREFEISRKTGHKLKKRFEMHGVEGLYERSRRPKRSPQRTPQVIAERVVALRRKYPTWGPKKLRVRLQVLHPEIRWPAASTIGILLKDAGLVDGRKRRRRAWPTPASERRQSQGPNEVWCIDFKGQFRLGKGHYCYPLTVTDHYSRFLLGCEALEGTKADPAGRALEGVFRSYGLPRCMRSDNGSPFASTGLGGLTQLSVWLLRLGIELERIDPGHPEQNGRHERMHLTLKQDTTRPAADNSLQQQERFDEFRTRYNEERPHEALEMRTPASFYEPSSRKLPHTLEPPSYPLHDLHRNVSQAGCVRLEGHDVYLSKALIGQRVGLTQLESATWLVSFMQMDLGYLDLSTRSVLPLPNRAT